jgi:hypothetical protein
MNPYFVEKTTVQDYLVSRDRKSWTARYDVASCNGVCSPTFRGVEVSEASWTEQGHSGHWFAAFPSIQTFGGNVSYADALSKAVTSTQTSVVAKTRNEFDLLTTLGEMRETLNYLSQTINTASGLVKKFSNASGGPSNVASFSSMRPRDALRSSNRTIQSMGNRWMEYRYAIMPLVYTVQDLLKVLGKQGILFAGYHSFENIPIIPIGVPNGVPDIYLERSVTGNILVASHAKCRYDKFGINGYTWATLGLNPLSTAWELVPLSFVVDWFINVGDYIRASTSPDFSLESKFCTSIKLNLREETWLNMKGTDSFSFSRGASPCGAAFTLTRSHNWSKRGLLTVKTTESLHRSLFTPSDVGLTIQPNFMNWKRWIDAFVLSHQRAKSVFRSI